MRASVAAGNSARFPFSERVSASRLGERNDAANRFVGRVLSAVRAPLVGSRRVRSSLSAAGDSADRVFDAGACAAFLCVVSRALFSPFLFVCSSFSIEGPQDAVKSSVLSLLHALFELLDVYTTRLAKDRAVRRLVYRICLQLDALGFHDSVSIASSQRRATLRAVFELLSIPFNRKLVARLSSASESKAAMSQSEANRSESKAILSESEFNQSESKVIRNESKVSESESEFLKSESKVAKSESMAIKSKFSIAQSEFKAALSESPVGSAANSRRSSFARAQRAEFDAEWMRNCGEAAKVRLRETEEAEERAPRGKKTAGRARRRESRGEEAGRAKTRAKAGRWSESPRAASEPTKRWSEKSNRLSEKLSEKMSESSNRWSESSKQLSEKSNQLNEKSNRLSEKLSESSKHLSESSKHLSEPSGEPSTEKLDASPDSKEKSIESKSNSTDSPSKPQTETPCFCYQVERDPDALPNPSARFHYQVDGYSCQCDDCVQNPIELFDTFDPNYENYVSSEEIESFLLYMEFLLLIVKKPNDCFEQSFGSHLSEMSYRYRVL